MARNLASAEQHVCGVRRRLRGKQQGCSKQTCKPRRRFRSKQPPFGKQRPKPVLHVWSPNGQYLCMGRYELVVGRLANDWPIWRMCRGNYWLYSGPGAGNWCIGAQDVKTGGFTLDAGFLLSERPHRGAMPEQVPAWQRWDGEEFHVSDPNIRVTREGWAACSVMYVTSSNHPVEVCAGVYELVPGGMANGWPLWKMKGAEYWMYSCKDGCWGVGARDVRAKGFDCSAGFILSVEPHRGRMPQEVAKWERWDEGRDQFLADPAISVSDVEPAGCWRLSTGYCGHALCRSAHDGNIQALAVALARRGTGTCAGATCSTVAASVPCEVTENDALCEAAVEGRSLAVELLLLEGTLPGRAASLCRPVRSTSQAVRWEASTPLEEPDDAAMRFMAETLKLERTRSLRMFQLRFQAQSTLSSLPPDVLETVLDFLLAKPPTRVRHPESLAGLRAVLRHVLNNSSLRAWLPLMKRCSPRWNQIVRNWDYFEEEIFFRREKGSAELEQEVAELCGSSSSGAPVRFVGRSVLDERCRTMLLCGMDWPPKERAAQAAPAWLRQLYGWRSVRYGSSSWHRCTGRNFFRALPDDAFQRVLDYLVHRRLGRLPPRDSRQRVPPWLRWH